MLSNMDPPPTEGNVCDDSNHPVKPHIMEQYNQYMGYDNNCDGMANSYSMRRRSFKWTTKLLDLQYSTVRYFCLHVGLNKPTEMSGSFW
jgi:hypothetical protein